MTKATWAAPERNKAPILEVLSRVLTRSGTLLELASGSGQHAAFFAANLPHLRYVPSDVEPENLASIRAWVHEAKLPNLCEPLVLDVASEDWGVGQVEVIFNANMIHISPWECAEGVVSGAARHLGPGGVLVLYGPFRIGGEHTAPSNASFDDGLRARDARWGVRDLEAVVALAEPLGLTLSERIAMPANNQTLVFTRA